jgi:hypothetical protein
MTTFTARTQIDDLSPAFVLAHWHRRDSIKPMHCSPARRKGNEIAVHFPERTGRDLRYRGVFSARGPGKSLTGMADA